MVPQDGLEVFNAVEDVDAYSTVVASWFQQPEVFILVFRGTNAEDCFKSLIML
jgi:hypothetical protein